MLRLDLADLILLLPFGLGTLDGHISVTHVLRLIGHGEGGEGGVVLVLSLGLVLGSDDSSVGLDGDGDNEVDASVPVDDLVSVLALLLVGEAVVSQEGIKLCIVLHELGVEADGGGTSEALSILRVEVVLDEGHHRAPSQEAIVVLVDEAIGGLDQDVITPLLVGTYSGEVGGEVN